MGRRSKKSSESVWMWLKSSVRSRRSASCEIPERSFCETVPDTQMTTDAAARRRTTCSSGPVGPRPAEMILVAVPSSREKTAFVRAKTAMRRITTASFSRYGARYRRNLTVVGMIGGMVSPSRFASLPLMAHPRRSRLSRAGNRRSPGTGSSCAGAPRGCRRSRSYRSPTG